MKNKPDEFKEKLDELFDIALEISGEHYDYTDKHLMYAAFILSEVLFAKSFDFHKEKINQDGMHTFAKELGGSLRQTIKLYTGVDMHNISKDE